MRIAVVSDIHGNLPALEAVVADLSRRGVDAVINLGDSLSGPLLPRETAQYLMAQPWFHLAGNHERQILTHGDKRGPSDAYAFSQLTQVELDWLATQRSVHAYADDVLLCHGTPTSDLQYFLETLEPTGVRAASRQEVEERLGAVETPLVLCGHTHVPRAVRTGRGQLIVNPGSVGLQAYDDEHPWPHKIENGSPDARYAIVERRQSVWSASLITVPYDHASMAELARQHGRPGWARPLMTGYLS